MKRCIFHGQFAGNACPTCTAEHRTSRPCRTCGIYCDTFECVGCWEVEHRLSDYAKSDNGRAKLREAIAVGEADVRASERMRWRLSESAAVELLNLVIKGPKTVEAQEIIARCVMPALSGCPKCGACLGVNIDCDLCDTVMTAWRAVRERLAATGEGVRLPGDDEVRS